jgi:hypothetical protein
MELIPHNFNIAFVGKRLFFALFSTALNAAPEPRNSKG